MSFRQFSNMTFYPRDPEQLKILKAALAERRTWSKNERQLYPLPEFVDDSVVTGTWWALGVLWQDRPEFVAGGIFCWIVVLLL